MDISFDVEVTCTGCGSVLNAYQRGGRIEVDPCQSCIDRERSDAKREGYDEGFNDGESQSGSRMPI